MLAFSAIEWASFLSAFWAAVAATAAWGAVITDRRRQREARKPNVSAGFLVPPNRFARIAFVNGGPGLAVQLGYLGVTNDGRKYGGYVRNGYLPAGMEAEVSVGEVASRQGQATFIWCCRDVDNTVHVWGYDGSYRRIAAKVYLSGKGPRTLCDYFRLVYPNVTLPPGPASTGVG